MSLKIGAIPNRKPRKVTLSFPPEIADALQDYTVIHAREHGSETTVAELALLMIARFLETDRSFQRARKSLRSSTAGKE